MARYVFKLPDVGEGTAEAEIVKWHVKIGDEVKEEQPLVDIMTDKATVEVASPVSGRIVTLIGEEGTRSAVGSELVVFETETENEAKPLPEAKKQSQAEPAQAARNISGKALASPAVRARAKSLGIDLSTVKGTGEDGHILHADLDAVLKQQPQEAPVPESLPPLPQGAEDIKIFGLRRRIAERMLESKRRIPHFTYVEEVDMTALEEVRARMNTEQDEGQRLTILPFVIRAMIKGIGQHPGVNAHYFEQQGIIRRFAPVHVGIATQTERGLLVPVIHNAQDKGLWQLARDIARLSAEARDGKSNPKELTGSTITVTSLGALGGIAATPIINPPEVAVIGVNRLAERPVVIDGAITIRKMMNLSSSFDHRIVDGYNAAAFIKSVKDELERAQPG
jgi:2-oxoisovalerate dehydrogenase E2 component (dihydrolipoyl transacylase)